MVVPWVQPLPAVPGVRQGSPRWLCAGWGPLPVGTGGSRGSQGWLGLSGAGYRPSLPVLGECSGVPRLSLETPGWLPPNWDPRCPRDGRRVPSPSRAGCSPLPRGPEVAGAAGLGPGVSPSRLGKPRLGREMIPAPSPLCFPAPWPLAGRSPRPPRGVPMPQASLRRPPRLGLWGRTWLGLVFLLSLRAAHPEAAPGDKTPEPEAWWVTGVSSAPS